MILHSFSSRLFQFSDKLTSSEEIIARYIAYNPEKVTTMKIEELTKQLYTSKSSLVRFCQKLGYTGFIDLKNQLKEEILDENNRVSFTNSDSSGMIDLLNDYQRILERFYKFINEDDFNIIEKLITHARCVVVYGSGHEATYARDLSLKLKRLGVFCIYVTSEHEMNLTIHTLEKKSLIILLSYTSKNTALYNIINTLRHKEIDRILITSYSNTNISKMVRYIMVIPNLIYLKSRTLISPTFVFTVFTDLLISHLIKNNKLYYLSFLDTKEMIDFE